MLHRKIRLVEKNYEVNTNVQEHLLGNLVIKSFQCHFYRTGTVTCFVILQ